MQGRGLNGVGLNGAVTGTGVAKLDRGGNRIAGERGRHTQTPFPGLIRLHGSMWTLLNQPYCWHRSEFDLLGLVGLGPGQVDRCAPMPRKPLANRNPLQDAAKLAPALLHCHAEIYAASGCPFPPTAHELLLLLDSLLWLLTRGVLVLPRR